MASRLAMKTMDLVTRTGHLLLTGMVVIIVHLRAGQFYLTRVRFFHLFTQEESLSLSLSLSLSHTHTHSYTRAHVLTHAHTQARTNARARARAHTHTHTHVFTRFPILFVKIRHLKVAKILPWVMLILRPAPSLY